MNENRNRPEPTWLTQLIDTDNLTHLDPGLTQSRRYLPRYDILYVVLVGSLFKLNLDM